MINQFKIQHEVQKFYASLISKYGEKEYLDNYWISFPLILSPWEYFEGPIDYLKEKNFAGYVRRHFFTKGPIVSFPWSNPKLERLSPSITIKVDGNIIGEVKSADIPKQTAMISQVGVEAGTEFKITCGNFANVKPLREIDFVANSLETAQNLVDYKLIEHSCVLVDKLNLILD